MRCCSICGQGFEPPVRPGWPQLQCSESCRKAHKREVARVWAAKKRAQRVRVCAVESCETVVGKSKQYCDDCASDRKAAYSLVCRQKERAGAYGTCSDTDCSRGVRARGMCNMHYRRWARANGVEKNPEWNDRRRSNYHNRRARLAGGRNGDTVMLERIVARNGTLCAWCGEDVDLSVAWPSPLSKSIDHIVPVSRGGLHVLENCQLMHLGCNSSKGNKLAA